MIVDTITTTSTITANVQLGYMSATIRLNHIYKFVD